MDTSNPAAKECVRPPTFASGRSPVVVALAFARDHRRAPHGRNALARRIWIAVAGHELAPWIFPALTDEANPLNPAHLRFKVWYHVLKHAGLRSIRLHDLRHTYASLLLQAGEPIAYVEEQLGHSSIQVTVDLYGHFVPGANRRAVERLAAATTSTGIAAPRTSH